jgi:seryl-tRNA synthetase
LKAEYNKVAEEAQRREKEAQKLEKKRKDNEKKMEGLKASAEKEIETLINREKKITKADELYYALGWIAGHVGTISAKMPDYLESAFVKHFGDVEHTVVDSTKVGPSGYTSQWRLSMEVSLKKPETVPSILSEYLSQNGKKLSKTSFVWSLVDDYGFKFGKKQDIVEILRCVPIEYVPIFNEGLKA